MSFVLGSHTQTGSFLAADEHRKEEKQLIIKAEMFSSTSFAVSKSHTQQSICYMASRGQELWTRDVDRYESEYWPMCCHLFGELPPVGKAKLSE